MNPNQRILTRLGAIGGAALLLSQSLQAAIVIPVSNGGFDSGTANWAGSFLAGDEGGNGWGTGYFGGSFPTNNTFLTSSNTNIGGVGAPITQSLAGNTFVEGATYTLSADIFGVRTYAQDVPVMWSLGLTADGTMVGRDHWFSEESMWALSSVGANQGGTIPDSHIITVDSNSTGLTHVSLIYTATAADAGKTIGIALQGDTQPANYTFAGTPPSFSAGTDHDYYGFMDNVTLSYVEAVPEPGAAMALMGGAAMLFGLRRRRNFI